MAAALDTAKRWICHAIGCRMSDTAPVCERCGGALYYDFIDEGRLEPLISACRRLMDRLKAKRCIECGARMPRRSKEEFCSAKCFDNWIPF